MSLIIKVFSIFVFISLSVPALSWTADYVSAFKPVEKAVEKAKGGMYGLQKNIRKEAFEIKTLINLRDKEIVSLTNQKKKIKNNRIPAEI